MIRIARLAPLTFAGLLLFAASGCDEKQPATDQGTQQAAQTTQAASGTTHKPPIEPADVPAGHWYCDMGTVHYSQPNEGDGTCPVCNMKLKQKK